MDPFGLVGQVLDGHFRVDRYVGEGGFSTVYRGTHVGLSEPIAVKCLKLPAALGSALVDSFVKRFRDESRIHYKLSQGNLHIARSIASGTTIAPATGALVPYTVLEWLEGRSLAEDFTDRRGRGLSGRPLREVVQIFDSAVDALAYAHAQGVVHRDMNPGNLFFAKTPSGTKLKVLDFGVAKILADSALAMGPSARTVGNVRMFAPAYAAPEQFDERVGAIGPETDVYALGLVLLEALMDRTVREGEHLGEFAARALDEANPPTPRALGIAVGDEVERVLGRAVALKPGDRPGDAGELWGMLKHAMRADSDSGRPARADKSVSRPPPVTQRMSEPVPSRANTPVVEVPRPKADPSRSFGGTLRMENRPPRTASDALAATPFPARVAATLPLVEHTPAPAPPVAPLGLVPAPMSGPGGNAHAVSRSVGRDRARRGRLGGRCPRAAVTSKSVRPSLFERACRVIPGGVNSPVRAFRAVGGTPVFVSRAEGAYLHGADGTRYVDYVGSWGPMILGHAHPAVVDAVREAATRGTSYGAPTELEVRFAETLCALYPSVEMVRAVSSGTEATMSALRVARGFTGRDAIVKFEGCYHGHADELLVKAGSGAATLGVPDSAGVPASTAANTLTLPFNDAGALRALFAARGAEIAAVIVEPVVGNMGVVPPAPGFLEAILSECTKHGAVSIFDEVMTGCRVARGGMQERMGLLPDMTCLGKIVGGGMPLAAYGGKRTIMEKVAPLGPVYQAGTLSGNPVAVSAGLATIERLDGALYTRLEALSARLEVGLARAAARRGVSACVQRVGSMITLFFTPGPVRSWADAKRCDTKAFAKWHAGMIQRGVHWPPAQFEAAFVSDAHTADDIDATIAAAEQAL